MGASGISDLHFLLFGGMETETETARFAQTFEHHHQQIIPEPTALGIKRAGLDGRTTAL